MPAGKVDTSIDSIDVELLPLRRFDPDKLNMRYVYCRFSGFSMSKVVDTRLDLSDNPITDKSSLAVEQPSCGPRIVRTKS